MSKGDRRQRLARILKDAEPALDQPGGNGKTVGIGDIAGQANQVVVGNDNIVITDSSRDTKQRPSRKAIRLLNMGLIILCVPLLFCVDRTHPPDPTITGSITTITAQNEPDLQTADLADTTGPLTVIHAQPGFHCYAGCSFLKPTRTIDPLAGQKHQDI